MSNPILDAMNRPGSERQLSQAAADMYAALTRFFEANPSPEQANRFLSDFIDNVVPVVVHARSILNAADPPTHARH